MLSTRDSFLKFLQVGLTGSGIPVVSKPDAPLQVNALNVLFLVEEPEIRTNPGRYALTVSLDVLSAGDGTSTAERKALQMAEAVNAALASQKVVKQNWAIPASPVPLGSGLFWPVHHAWRRIEEPDSRYEHLNRTLVLLYFEEQRT